MKHKHTLSPHQRGALLYCLAKYKDRRFPPWAAGNHRTIQKLIERGFIEHWDGWGAPMYRITDAAVQFIDSLEGSGRPTNN